MGSIAFDQTTTNKQQIRTSFEQNRAFKKKKKVKMLWIGEFFVAVTE
jgi:hypothetical protein